MTGVDGQRGQHREDALVEELAHLRALVGVELVPGDDRDARVGERREEAGLVAFPYKAEAGVNWHARLMLGYQVSRHWAFSLVAEYERLNDEAAASPIVEDHNVLGWFAGLAYRF